MHMHNLLSNLTSTSSSHNSSVAFNPSGCLPFLLVYSIFLLFMHSIITDIFTYGLYLACYASVWFTRFGLLVALCSQRISIVGLLKHLCITHFTSIYLHFKRSPKHFLCLPLRVVKRSSR
ncbi:uncharacterized protein EDB91DRAFT_871812 [Suillus paluster]|uniref:uncharacterized protein n=1 Tax=Suillus paluster TaxID=48578 RepID=UPI001B871747|nr:uncharacterized protein EDB91DRAFT_871812 [Suillus paluster]KAG1748280.1 hypothetical protein EDB91DRAFT_871812 [Suillus paluster]